MKFLIVAFVCLVGVVLANPPWLQDSKFDGDRDAWLKFKQNPKKILKYVRERNEEYRFEKFMENRKKVKEHKEKFDKGEVTWELATNEFADYDGEEFVKSHCGTRVEKMVDLNKPVMFELPSARQSNPAYWDVRKDGPGKILAIKDQGDCGSCWAFATSAAVENLLSQTQTVVPLSEQQQLDCNYLTYGCDGGWFTTAFQYTMKRGLTSSAVYPYYEKELSCRDTLVSRPYTHLSYVQVENNPETIKTYIRTRGVCAVCVDANNWQLYGGGVFNGAGSAPQCNHAVALIGWGPDYWLIRNSWGTNWGESGYIKVSTQKTGGMFTEYVYCPTK